MEYVLGAGGVGLCSTCNNNVDAACSYRALRGFDAQYCEMYDDTVLAATLMTNGQLDPSSSVQAATESGALGLAEFKGLCVNCENRSGCRMARAEGGIWHCEEYM